jgi:hypothetical protein
MRVFIVACFAAGVIAIGTAAILDKCVQEPVAVAFAEPGTRVSPDVTPNLASAQ